MAALIKPYLGAWNVLRLVVIAIFPSHNHFILIGNGRSYKLGWRGLDGEGDAVDLGASAGRGDLFKQATGQRLLRPWWSAAMGIGFPKIFKSHYAKIPILEWMDARLVAAVRT